MGNKTSPTQLQPTRIIAYFSTQFLTRSVFEIATGGGKLCKDHLPAGRKLSEWAQYIPFISSHNMLRGRGDLDPWNPLPSESISKSASPTEQAVCVSSESIVYHKIVLIVYHPHR